MATITFGGLPSVHALGDAVAEKEIELLPIRKDLLGEPSKDGVGKGRALSETQFVFVRDVKDSDLPLYRVALISTSSEWDLAKVEATVKFGSDDGFVLEISGFLVDGWTLQATSNGDSIKETLVIRANKVELKVKTARITGLNHSLTSKLA